MKLEQLNYFSTVAKTQHIGRAAKMVNISPSAISHSIRALEEELGHKLFQKAGKNIFLTDMGKRFAKKAQYLLDEAEKVKLEFLSPDSPLEGVFRVGASHGLSEHIVAGRIG